MAWRVNSLWDYVTSWRAVGGRAEFSDQLESFSLQQWCGEWQSMLEPLLWACCTCSSTLGTPLCLGALGTGLQSLTAEFPFCWQREHWPVLPAPERLLGPVPGHVPRQCAAPHAPGQAVLPPGNLARKGTWALRGMFWGRLSTINTGLLIFGLCQPALQSATSCLCNKCSWRSSHIAGNQFEAGRVDDSCLLVLGETWEQLWVIIYDLQLVLQPRLDCEL